MSPGQQGRSLRCNRLTSEGSGGQSALCLPRLATAQKTCDDWRDAGRAVDQHQVTTALDDVKLGTGNERRHDPVVYLPRDRVVVAADDERGLTDRP